MRGEGVWAVLEFGDEECGGFDFSAAVELTGFRGVGTLDDGFEDGASEHAEDVRLDSLLDEVVGDGFSASDGEVEFLL